MTVCKNPTSKYIPTENKMSEKVKKKRFIKEKLRQCVCASKCVKQLNLWMKEKGNNKLKKVCMAIKVLKVQVKYKSIYCKCHCVLKCVKLMREMFTLDQAVDLLKERRK